MRIVPPCLSCSAAHCRWWPKKKASGSCVSNKVHRVMHEYKVGSLHSGSSKGRSWSRTAVKPWPLL